MESRDLIHALRLWLPDGKSVAGVRQQLAERLADAFDEFRRAAAGSEISDPADVMPLAATAVARGLLQEAVQSAKGRAGDHLPSGPLKDLLEGLSWPDLLLTAACAHKDEAANRELLSLVQLQILPPLARKWGFDQAREIADDLPQILHLLDQRGLNRGRPRLLAYGGRCRLVTWLRAVAHQRAIDLWRARRREQPDDELAEAPDRSTSDRPMGGDEQLSHEEDLALIRRIGPRAFEQLMRQLPAISEQQYRFAYFRCVGGLDNADIADRLGVGKSRVTELSQQVFRRLIAILVQLAPELGEVSNEPTKERRRKVEEALQEWFGAAEPGDDSELPDGSAGQRTLRVTEIDE